MNSRHNPKLVQGLARRATTASEKYAVAELSPLVQEARQADRIFAQKILAAIDKAKSIEDLIYLEKTLQKLDLLRARNPEDRDSIIAAQKRYDQLSMTIEQIRTNPDTYIRLCMANIKNVNSNPYRIPYENSIAFINGNVTRLRNRAAFAPDSERDIWEARIAAAERMVEMFKELHNAAAAEFDEKQKLA